VFLWPKSWHCSGCVSLCVRHAAELAVGRGSGWARVQSVHYSSSAEQVMALHKYTTKPHANRQNGLSAPPAPELPAPPALWPCRYTASTRKIGPELRKNTHTTYPTPLAAYIHAPCRPLLLVVRCPLPDRPPPTTTTRQPSTGQGATREGKKTTYLPTYLFLQKISKNTSDFFIVFLEKKSVLDFWSILFLKLFDTILFAKRFL
jgi:hypothetical protein